MDSVERVRRVLEGRLPDQVPVLLQNFQNTAWLAGIKIGEFCQSAENMAAAQVAAWERFGYDVIDLENGTAAMAQAMGCDVVFPDDEPPRVIRPALESLEAGVKIKQVNPYHDGHLPDLLNATRRVRAEVREHACIVGEADQGPFSLAGLVVGIEDWLVALLDPAQHAMAHRLLDICTEQVLRFCLAQAEAGADLVEIGDSLAGPDVCSPRIYRQFAFPYEQRLARELRQRGIPLILHICGNATSIIADMAATGATVLEVDYKVNAPRCRELVGKRAVLAGDVDPSGVMALGTPDEVRQAARRAIMAMGQEGQFILSPGCTLPATTSPENTVALIETARDYGRYGSEGLLCLD